MPRIKRALPIVSALTVGLLGGGIAGYAAHGEGEPKLESSAAVAGVIHCPAGEPVTGAWVDVYNATSSGWADWAPSSEQPNIATYTKAIGATATNYRLNVGCGGTPQKWEHSNPTPAIPNNAELVSVTCTDAVGIKVGACTVGPLIQQ
jgi:hypothetical protein